MFDWLLLENFLLSNITKIKLIQMCKICEDKRSTMWIKNSKNTIQNTRNRITVPKTMNNLKTEEDCE